MVETAFPPALPVNRATLQEDKMEVGSRDTLELFLSFQAGNYAEYLLG